MTITLEKIKEMNIPVGTPIELTINHSLYKEKKCNHKEMGYFQELKRVMSRSGKVTDMFSSANIIYYLIYRQNIFKEKTRPPKFKIYHIDEIVKIRKLSYEK